MIKSNNLPSVIDTDIVSTYPEINSLIDLFVSSKDIKPVSRQLYKRTLRQYFNWIKKNDHDLSRVTIVELLRYKDDLFSSGLSNYTVSSYLTVLREFYAFAEANKYYPNIAKTIKTPKRVRGLGRDPLTIEQVKQLLGTIDRSTLRGKRDYAILNLMVHTGLRTIEVIRADVGDIQYKGGELVLYVHSKGRDSKDNFVLVTERCYGPIFEYLEARGANDKPKEPLFTSESNNNQNKRMTTRSISFIAKSNLRKINLNSRKYTAHSLRHTAGVNVLENGGDLYATQLFMRHSDPATTQIYLRSVEEGRRLKYAPEKILDTLY